MRETRTRRKIKMSQVVQRYPVVDADCCVCGGLPPRVCKFTRRIVEGLKRLRRERAVGMGKEEEGVREPRRV